MTGSPEREPPERAGYLALLATPPAIWTAHFLVTYITVATWCGPQMPQMPQMTQMTQMAQMAQIAQEPLTRVHLIIAGYTVAALLAIAAIGFGAYRRHRHGDETLPHDSDSPGDRHRFLGFATLLLSGLSAIATLFVAVSTSFFGSCR
jgi:hypothetical protein